VAFAGSPDHIAIGEARLEAWIAGLACGYVNELAHN